MMRKFFLLFSVLIFSGFICLAQESADSTDDWEWDWDDDESEWNFDDISFRGRPTIETPYGIANTGLKSIDNDFMKVGIAELRLGFANQKDFKDNIIKYSNKFLLVSNISNKLNSKSNNSTDLNPEMWRFGFGGIDGYGYGFYNAAIIPYTSTSFIWTRLEVKNLDDFKQDTIKYTPSEVSTLKLFNNSFRFGTMTEGGLRIQVIPLISLNAGYERTVVFPRVLVWKFLGSAVIEGIAVGAINEFVEEIMDNSPAAGPIVNFVLKNALSFGMYQLRHEKMNWPFKSANPLYSDTWKVGVTFTF